MNDHEGRVLLYRQRADELRMTATAMIDPYASKSLRKVAAAYDHLAGIQERLAKQTLRIG